MADDIFIFGGSGSPKLTLKICEYLQVRPGEGEVLRFSDGNLFVRVTANV
ncbi:MAG: ribose-phosphate pyrophosphokinase-like domain-containing protein, partial [Candidatus Tectomicrobia bacterium]